MTSKHPDFVGPDRLMTHFYFTPKEMDSRSGKGPGTHDHDSALCGNGSFHFKRSKDKEKITCPACLHKLGIPVPFSAL